jgi:putative ABC transport system substrate-binding protein
LIPKKPRELIFLAEIHFVNWQTECFRLQENCRAAIRCFFLPSATNLALLVNPAVPSLAEPAVLLSRAAADAAGLQLQVLHASSERDFDKIFENLSQLHAAALSIAPDNLFTAHSEQLAALTVRHALPAVYEFRRFAAAGGLMSYGSSETEYYRLVGAYTGRILKGEKPADLPVQQSTKLDLVINQKTAKALGLTIPSRFLAALTRSSNSVR